MHNQSVLKWINRKTTKNEVGKPQDSKAQKIKESQKQEETEEGQCHYWICDEDSILKVLISFHVMQMYFFEFMGFNRQSSCRIYYLPYSVPEPEPPDEHYALEVW